MTSDGKVHLPSNAGGSAKLINASDKIVHIPGEAASFPSFTQHWGEESTTHSSL